MTDIRGVCFLGYGYTAAHLAQHLNHLMPENPPVMVGTKRCVTNTATNTVEILPFNTPHLADQLSKAFMHAPLTHIVISIPPSPDLHLVNMVLRLQAQHPSLRWVGYLSSTSVYGDHKGHWVTEESQTDPLSDQGQARLEDEQAWLTLHATHRTPTHIFRLGGIYGPGRSILDRIKTGHATLVDSSVTFSRIHVADIARTLTASMRAPTPGHIYNVVDDKPASNQDVTRYGYHLLGKTPPEPVSIDTLPPSARVFYEGGHKKVANLKMKQQFPGTLSFKTYKEGLDALYGGL